ncbi:MAG: hypothetical protein AAFY02_21595 [Pseudomonadota bacterium]
MSKRKPVTAETVAAVAADSAGHRLPPARVAAMTEMVEMVAQQMVTLRQLPLKDCEPAVMFRPIETPKR